MWWYNRKVAAPDDGCINVRNMLSTEEVKYNLIKLWHQIRLLFFNYHNDARSNIYKIRICIFSEL